jgi:hypothetical protein
MHEHANPDAASLNAALPDTDFPSWPAAAWLEVAHGFARLVWSLPLLLFLLTGAVQFPQFPLFRLPSYTFAVIIALWGLAALRRARSADPSWNRRIRRTQALCLLLLYFAPFMQWWIHLPMVDHLTLNIYGLTITCIMLLWNLCRLAELVAVHLDNRTFFIEARLCGIAVLALLLVPVLGFQVYALGLAVVYGMPLHQSTIILPYLPWAGAIFALMLVPFSLTIAIAWKAKESAYRQLKALAEVNEAD